MTRESLRRLRRRLGRRWRGGGSDIEARLDILEAALREAWETNADALRRLEETLARTRQVSGLEAAGLDGIELRNVLWSLAAQEPANRSRLWQLRESPDYELAYSDPEPLVSIVIPSRDRPQLLAERSVPSALGQTYGNVEVVVVGDAAGVELEEALASLQDPRVVYRNLTQRVTVSDDERKHWLVAATMARNEGSRLARGRWVVALDDDDELREDSVQRLLALARDQRVEVAYGKLRPAPASAHEGDIGEFPPRPNAFAWQAAIYHAGLRFFERELVAAEFATPGDWFLLQRMLRAGVRFAMTPEVVAHYYPSQG
jgi:hypothetical protein